MRNRHERTEARTHVRDQGEVEHFRTHLGGGDDLWNGRHGGHIGTHASHRVDLGHRLVRPTLLEGRDAEMERDAHLERALLGELEQLRGEDCFNRRELDAEIGNAGTSRGIGAVECDLTADTDDVARFEIARDRTGCMCEDELFDAQLDHEPSEEHDLVGREALVEVNPTLQHDHRNTTQLAPAETTSMARRARNGAVRNLEVLGRISVFEKVR